VHAVWAGLDGFGCGWIRRHLGIGRYIDMHLSLIYANDNIRSESSDGLGRVLSLAFEVGPVIVGSV
jgi:hypothetical protein